MAIIKCSECLKEVSDKANNCIHCGNPLVSMRSEVIVYGLKQTFLIGGTMKIFIDEEYVGSVKKGDKIVIPIKKDCFLTAKCGINVLKGKKSIKYGTTTKIQIVYDRLLGGFQMQEVDFSTASQ